MAVAHAALDPSADLAVVAHVEVVHSLMAVHAEAVRSLTAEVHSHMAEVLIAVVRSLMVEVVLTVVVLTDMVAWEAVDKIIVPAHVPLHSSCAVSRS